MRRRSTPVRVVGAMAIGGLLVAASPTEAQAEPHGAEGAAEIRALHAHVGIGVSQRLLRSPDPGDRVLGIEHASALGTAEAALLLASSLEPAPATGRDLRPLVALSRALAESVANPSAPPQVRAALLRMASVPELKVTPHDDVLAALTRDAAGDDRDDTRAGLLEMARDTAALGLARSGDADALTSLFGLVRRGGAPSVAAAKALLAFPPVTWPMPAGRPASAPADLSAEPAPEITASLAAFLGVLGDLRALPALREAASGPVEVRAAALVARATLGDRTVLPEAEALRGDPTALLRVAAVEALVRLDAPQGGMAVERLLAREDTRSDGVRLAMRARSPGLVRALAAATVALGDLDRRAAAVAAIGHQGGTEARSALAALVHDPVLAGDAAYALARLDGPLPTLRALAREDANDMQQLALRAYAVHRAVTGGRRDAELSALAERCARSPDGASRALGISVRALDGGASAAPALEDPDPRVRRAAAMVVPSAELPGDRWAREEDPLTREVLARGWLGRGGDMIPTGALAARAFSGRSDAPLAAYTLAARGSATSLKALGQLLADPDPILRAHVARGLGRSPREAASGQLAAAYPFETDAAVRRAIVLSLGARAQSRSAPPDPVLAQAMRLDPDASVREAAHRAWTGRPRGTPDGEGPSAGEPAGAAWVRLLGADGSAPDPRAGGAMVVGTDGFARPVAFDDDGYAVMTGLPSGGGRLVLAPRIPAAYVVREP